MPISSGIECPSFLSKLQDPIRSSLDFLLLVCISSSITNAYCLCGYALRPRNRTSYRIRIRNIAIFSICHGLLRSFLLIDQII
jgi:hypothetical protein